MMRHLFSPKKRRTYPRVSPRSSSSSSSSSSRKRSRSAEIRSSTRNRELRRFVGDDRPHRADRDYCDRAPLEGERTVVVELDRSDINQARSWRNLNFPLASNKEMRSFSRMEGTIGWKKRMALTEKAEETGKKERERERSGERKACGCGRMRRMRRKGNGRRLCKRQPIRSKCTANNRSFNPFD